MNNTNALRVFRFLILIISVSSLLSCNNSKARIDGELKKWHKVTLTFDGPETSELAEENPFLDYRLDVTFTNGDQKFLVPGFYAADGDAAETSAQSGNKWMARFTPNREGDWTYQVSFTKGANLAIEKDASNGQSAGFIDGASGTFAVGSSDKTGIDNRAKGRLNYVGDRFLQYEDSKEYFIKVGVDAPENLLGYEDFDASTNALSFRKSWSYHESDFQEDARPYLWQGEKGKNLLGAIHYLATEELNVFSFLTFNVDGDDRNIIPHLLNAPVQDYEAYANEKKNKEAWENYFHKTRFDVSKLDQWERTFEYAETQGMFLHFKTHETETDHLMDKGVFGTEGKLYYRELIARFGHHLSLNWNLGEENNQPIEEVKKVANYVYNLDPYKHHLVIHTFPNQDARYGKLIGEQSPLTGASLQLGHEEFIDVHPRVLKWRHKSDSTGKKWALAVDEPGRANIALLPDDEDLEHNAARHRALWGVLMAGGYGVEWYFGYKSPHSDLTCEDFRSRDIFWDQNRHARRFFDNQIPFWEMAPMDELTDGEESYCFAKKDQVYVVYVPMGVKTETLDLSGTSGTYSVQWYNPRDGGSLQNGSASTIEGGKPAALGSAPSDSDKDWIVLLQKK